MSRKISRSFINGRAGVGTAGQGLKVEWDSTEDGELHWKDVDESTLEVVVGDGNRGVFAGGYSTTVGNHDTIDYITISTTGNATDFGNLLSATPAVGGTSNGSRGLFGGGNGSGSGSNVIQYITILTTGNATDFGDLSNARKLSAAVSNYTNDRGCFAGGRYAGHSYTNIIDYVTISTLGNATDFGDMTYSGYLNGSTSNGTNDRGIWAGGQTPDATNIIDYITISSASNATDFGDLLSSSKAKAAFSNGTLDRAVWAGGDSSTNVMEYVTISTTGNSTDFGDLTSSRGYSCGASNGSNDRGVVAGGTGSINTIDYVTVSTTGNSTDFGDLTVARNDFDGLADAGGN